MRPSHAALNLFEPGLCEQLAGHAVRPKQMRAGAAKLALVTLAWLPIALLSREGSAVSIPFSRDLALHVRLLVELPSLLFFGSIATPWIRKAVEYARAHLVSPAHREELDRVASRTRRINRSSALALAVFSVALLGSILELAGWYEVRSGPSASSWRFHDGAITHAGMWFVLVARPILYSQLLLGLVRFVLWTRVLLVLRRIARPIPAHPDGFGGLSPIAVAHEAFVVIAFVLGADLAAALAMRLAHLHDSLITYRFHIALAIAGTMALLLAPLLLFVPALYDARVRATFTFGGAASIEARYIDASLRQPKDPAGEREMFTAHVHTADSLKRVRNLQLVPIHRRTLIVFACAVTIPFAACALLQIPLWQLLADLHKLSALEPLR
jgi:hypothetical protein